MDRYDTSYGRERSGHQGQVLDRIRNDGFFAPAKLARDARYQQLLDVAEAHRLRQSTAATARPSSPRATLRHRLGAFLIRLGTTLQGASAVAPRFPSPAGAIAPGEGR